MDNQDIVQGRLYNQRLAGEPFEKPEEIVSWLGAVQAQEYVQAKWALALRANGLTSADVERAFNEGRMLRTHVMRPTWHFVAPEDLRWLLKLTAPRVNVAVGSYYRKLELDEALVAKCNDVLARTLQGGKQLTRSELDATLLQAGVISEGDDRLRATFLIMRAELEGVICSGARRGKQHTYALLDERVPPGKELDRDEALAELTLRYFRSHGPATAYDFGWWSGLTLAEVREGLAMMRSELASETVDDTVYWFCENGAAPEEAEQTWLLPAFDEYLIGYTDRSAAHDEAFKTEINNNGLQTLVHAGRVFGLWKRTFKKGEVLVTLLPFTPLNRQQSDRIGAELERYGAFLEKPVTVIQTS